MRPVVASMVGKLGEHLTFIAFPGINTHGQRYHDPMKDGALVVRVGAVTLRYRLPLPSLLPKEIDPKTGESFPGNYHYNPFTCDKLACPCATVTIRSS